MRRYLLVLPILIACSGSDTPPPDSTAAASAAVTDADIAGTWTGTFTPEGAPDSMSVSWTDLCGNGTCRLVAANAPNDTVVSSYTIQGDSVVGVSTPYADTSLVKSGMVVDHWVARPRAGAVNGTGRMVLADKPDSVVLRYRFTGTRNP